MMELDPDLDLVLRRDLRAPPARVFACWTNAAHLPHWFVPHPHRVTACRLDPRVGGAFDTTFDVDGTVIENRGVFLEVVPDRRLVFTDSYAEVWKPAPDPFMTAILTFEPGADGGTRYTAVVRHRTAEAARRHAEMGFHDGWGIVADQLHAYAMGLGD